MRIAVIGAGPSGLCAAKNSIQAGHNVTVFEQGAVIGGQWAYSDDVDDVTAGQMVHSSMYKSLR